MNQTSLKQLSYVTLSRIEWCYERKGSTNLVEVLSELRSHYQLQFCVDELTNYIEENPGVGYRKIEGLLSCQNAALPAGRRSL